MIKIIINKEEVDKLLGKKEVVLSINDIINKRYIIKMIDKIGDNEYELILSIK